VFDGSYTFTDNIPVKRNGSLNSSTFVSHNVLHSTILGLGYRFYVQIPGCNLWDEFIRQARGFNGVGCPQ